MKQRHKVAMPGSHGKAEPAECGDETERTILDVAPEQEAFDWICYLVRGGTAGAEDAVKKRESDERSRHRPEREDIERVLEHLVSRGMLTCDDGRWSMTSKGYVRSRELGGTHGVPIPVTEQPGEPGASAK